MPDELETSAQAPVQEQAETQAESAVEEVKQEIDARDSAILAELRAIHDSINAQTEHHIRHLEQHTLTSQAPVQEVADNAAQATTENLPQEPVSLEISEAKDMPKETDKEHKKSRKFGKRGRRT